VHTDGRVVLHARLMTLHREQLLQRKCTRDLAEDAHPLMHHHAQLSAICVANTIPVNQHARRSCKATAATNNVSFFSYIWCMRAHLASCRTAPPTIALCPLLLQQGPAHYCCCCQTHPSRPSQADPATPLTVSAHSCLTGLPDTA
jgi:hypothetical protein